MSYAAPAGYKPKKQRSTGPAGVVGGKALRTRTKLAPYVGRRARGGGLGALPRTKRFANRGTGPTTEPKGGLQEGNSAPYRAAKRRTRGKARAF